LTRLRLTLGVAGLVLALVGVLRNDRAIVWVAIAAVGAALVLRLFARGAPPIDPT
jgi:membrane-bound ClpP family serine protease